MNYGSKFNNYNLLESGYYGRYSDARLPSDKRTIPLLGGLYQNCSVYLDKDTNTLRYSDRDKIFKCCLNNYTKANESCINKCNADLNKSTIEYAKCKELCEAKKNKWIESCSTIRIRKEHEDIFMIKAKKANCWNSNLNILDNNCLIKNKKEIIYECTQDCETTANTNCNNFCNTSYDLIVNPDNVSDLFNNRNIQIDNIDKIILKKKWNNTYIWIIIGIILGIILFIINKYVKIL